MAEARSRAEAELAGLAGQVAQIREASTRATRALALMQLGEQQLELDNRKGARQLYENALEIDPDNPAINYFLGELLIHERELDRGMQLLERAQQLAEKPYAPVEAAIAYGLRLQGERATDEADRDLLYARAVKQFQHALAIDRNVLNLLRESFHGSLAGLYKRQKKYDLAIQSYERAHEVTPQSSYPVINLANLHYWRGNLNIARPYYQQSERNADTKLARNPHDVWARMNRVVARLVLGDIEGAKSDVAELEPLVEQGHLAARDLSRIIGDLNLLHESPNPPAQIEWFDGAFGQFMRRLERIAPQS
jgi:tetratricopeptide (TPR) repeat protein